MSTFSVGFCIIKNKQSTADLLSIDIDRTAGIDVSSTFVQCGNHAENVLLKSFIIKSCI